MTVNVILLVAYAEVETTEAGEVMLHKLMACAVTRPAGKDSVILLLDACAVNGVDVLKVTCSVCSVEAAVEIAVDGIDTTLVHAALKGDDAALNPWFVILIPLMAFATPDGGTKL